MSKKRSKYFPQGRSIKIIDNSTFESKFYILLHTLNKGNFLKTHPIYFEYIKGDDFFNILHRAIKEAISTRYSDSSMGLIKVLLNSSESKMLIKSKNKNNETPSDIVLKHFSHVTSQSELDSELFQFFKINTDDRRFSSLETKKTEELLRASTIKSKKSKKTTKKTDDTDASRSALLGEKSEGAAETKLDVMTEEKEDSQVSLALPSSSASHELSEEAALSYEIHEREERASESLALTRARALSSYESSEEEALSYEAHQGDGSVSLSLALGYGLSPHELHQKIKTQYVSNEKILRHIAEFFANKIMETLYNDSGKSEDRKKIYAQKISEINFVILKCMYDEQEEVVKPIFIEMLKNDMGKIIGGSEKGYLGTYYSGLIEKFYNASRMSSILSYTVVGRISLDLEKIEKQIEFLSDLSDFYSSLLCRYISSYAKKDVYQINKLIFKEGAGIYEIAPIILENNIEERDSSSAAASAQVLSVLPTISEVEEGKAEEEKDSSSAAAAAQVLSVLPTISEVEEGKAEEEKDSSAAAYDKTKTTDYSSKNASREENSGFYKFLFGWIISSSSDTRTDSDISGGEGSGATIDAPDHSVVTQGEVAIAGADSQHTE